FDLEETESAGSKPKKGAKREKHHRRKKGDKDTAAAAPSSAAPAASDEEAPVISPDDEVAGEEPGSASAASGGDSLMGDLAAEDTSAPKAEGEGGPKLSEVSEEIYAVQQIYALRKNRIELMPSVGFSLNDPFVTHTNIGVGLNYWITNVLAVGANINWYQGLESEKDLNFHVRRSARLGTRPTEFRFGASLNMTYVPVYGKFSMFRRYIFQWDAYLMGGIGVMQTKPVPVVDPQIRNFDYTYKISILNPAIGLRVFISKWLTVFGELRAYPYLEKLENLDVGLGETARQNDKKWLDDSSTLVFNVVASIGLTVYFPFGFDYKLPK
ncbi:MAG TPA: outer membrane beta-barrel domain-containing protein, partial [Polyangiales bacterium]|nr:outer membrane beta-barrel domain-containing protein [Polyangiales bacterium]